MWFTICMYLILQHVCVEILQEIFKELSMKTFVIQHSLLSSLISAINVELCIQSIYQNEPIVNTIGWL